MPMRSMNIPSIDQRTAIDHHQITHLEDSIMEATVCQAVEVKSLEIAAEEQVKVDSISTLSSADMSFIGGGLCVSFA